MTGQEEKQVTKEDFMNAVAHSVSMLKPVSEAYIIVAMPGGDLPGPVIEFYGDADLLLMLQGRAEALVHHVAMDQMRPTLQRLGARPDQVNDPGVG